MQGSQMISVENNEGRLVFIDKNRLLSNIKVMCEHSGIDKQWDAKIIAELDDFIKKNPNQTRELEFFDVNKFINQVKLMNIEQKQDLKDYILHNTVKGVDILLKLIFLQGVISLWKDNNIAHFVRDAAIRRKEVQIKMPITIATNPIVPVKTKEQRQQEEDDYLLALTLERETEPFIPQTVPAAANLTAPTSSKPETNEEKNDYLTAIRFQFEDSMTTMFGKTDVEKINKFTDKALEFVSVVLFDLNQSTQVVEDFFKAMMKHHEIGPEKVSQWPAHQLLETFNIIHAYKASNRAYSVQDFEQFLLSTKQPEKEPVEITPPPAPPSLTHSFNATSSAARTQVYKPTKRASKGEEEEIEVVSDVEEKEESRSPKLQRTSFAARKK